MGMAAEAFVRKGWSGPGGFYAMIGSRQVVRNAVDDALFYERATGEQQSCTRLWDRNQGTTTYCPRAGDRSFEQALDAFFYGKYGIWQFDDSGGLAGTMDWALNNPDFHNNGGGDTPYEWGNPPVSGMPPGLRSALGVGHSTGIGNDQVYYKSSDGLTYKGNDPTTKIGGKDYYSIFFVVTQNQITPLCGATCVIGQ